MPKSKKKTKKAPAKKVAAKKPNEFIERVFYGTLLAIVAFFALYQGGPIFTAFASLVTVFMIFEFRSMIRHRKSANLLMWYIVMLVYLLVPVMSFVLLRNFNAEAAIWLVATVVASDIGGYAVGKAWGRNLLVPKISPKKTWEGLAGCCLFAGLASYAYTQMPSFIVIGAFLGLVSQAGDLTESAIKRYFGVKDAGSVIPGHGGFMDRLDGYLYAAPLVLFWQLSGALRFIG